MQEEWRDIKGYEGLYQVSNFGRVKSLERKCSGRWGERTVPEIILSHRYSQGYDYASIRENNISKSFRVHRLVWEAFNGPIPEGYEISHLDENSKNNRLDNLSLMTHKENNNWGTHNEKAAAAKINHPSKSKPVLQFTKGGEFIAEYPSIREVMRQTGINNSDISSCCLGKLKSAGGYKWEYKMN